MGRDVKLKISWDGHLCIGTVKALGSWIALTELADRDDDLLTPDIEQWELRGMLMAMDRYGTQGVKMEERKH